MTAIVSHRPEIQILIDGKDRTRLLGDQGSVRLQKSLYAPMGEAHIAFPDMPATDGMLPAPATARRDSLYGLVPVLAPVEIRLRRDTPDWTPVLRGFVRSVGRNESVGGDGRVQRQVVIVAHDCGAAFVMQTVATLISWQNEGRPIPAPFNWLREASLTSTPMPAGEFVRRLAVDSTRSILAAAGFEWDPQISVTKGTAVPSVVATGDGPIWAILERYADGPWNELFVREGAKNPELVFRPTPWRDIDGKPLPDAPQNVLAHAIPMSSILGLNAARDDVELVNHVVVTAPEYGISGYASGLSAQRGLVNAETREKFGDRTPSQLQTHLGPGVAAINLPAAEQQRAGTVDWPQWLAERLKWAVAAAKDIHQFERGSLTIKGDPRIRVGDYFTVQRGPLFWSGYAIGVSHDFQPYNRYLTHVEYIRGDQWIKRAEMPNPWELERQTA